MPMETILQIEYSPGLLSERRAILEPLGYDVISVLGFSDAVDRELLKQPIVVVARLRDPKLLGEIRRVNTEIDLEGVYRGNLYPNGNSNPALSSAAFYWQIAYHY